MSGSVSTAVTCGQHCGTGPGSETQLADLSVCVCVCVCVCECVCVERERDFIGHIFHLNVLPSFLGSSETASFTSTDAALTLYAGRELGLQ